MSAPRPARPLLLALALLTAPAAVAAPAGDDQVTQSYLVRPDDAPDPDARGLVRIRSVGKDPREELRVEARKVDGALLHELFLEEPAGSGALVLVEPLEGPAQPGGQDTLLYEADTETGSLPFEVGGLDELFGRRVEVRADGRVVLVGQVPDAFQEPERREAVVRLVRPDPPEDADARGSVALLSVLGRGLERLTVRVLQVDDDRPFALWMEDPPGSDDMDFVASLADGSCTCGGGDDDDCDDGGGDDDDCDDDEGGWGDDDDGDGPCSCDDARFGLKLNTKKKGESLPLDVDSVHDLLGRRVEIRSDGAVELAGTLPDAFEGPGTAQKLTLVLERPSDPPDGNAKGWIRMKDLPANGGERFEARAEDVDRYDEHELWVQQTPDGDGMAFAGKLKLLSDDDDDDGQGPGDTNLRLVRDVSEGEALPFFVPSTADLLGRRVEIRSAGDLVLEGRTPQEFAPDRKRRRAREDLQIAPGSPTPAARGRLSVTSRPVTGDERFELRLKKLPKQGGALRLFVESAPGSGSFAEAGQVTRKGKAGTYKARRKLGEALPLDASCVDELSGRRLQVRDASGKVCLEETVPDLEG